MAIVKKRIKGRYYLYEQHSKREGKKVKTTSRYIGPTAMDVAKGGIVAAYGVMQIASLLLGAYKRNGVDLDRLQSQKLADIGRMAAKKAEEARWSAEECFAHESGWGSRGAEKSAPAGATPSSEGEQS